jgi:hypothetical protein
MSALKALSGYKRQAHDDGCTSSAIPGFDQSKPKLELTDARPREATPSAIRGLLVAGALAVPVWVLIYLLVR